jgi:hypothetical protein
LLFQGVFRSSKLSSSNRMKGIEMLWGVLCERKR